VADAQDFPHRLVVYPGMSPELSAFGERDEARAAELRQAWLASGRPRPTTAPVIVSGKILTPTLNVTVAPAAPEISVKFQTGPAGLAYIVAYYYSDTSGQLRYATYYAPGDFDAPSPAKGRLKIEQPIYGALGLYSAAGSWTLEQLTIADAAGNSTVYTGSQLASLFPSLNITVTNSGTPDTQKPVVTAGKILTPTVKLSSAYPSFRAKLTVSDNLSGVANVCVYVQEPGTGGGFCDDGTPPSPLLSGTVDGDTILKGDPTGTWTIFGYQVCDVAGNCVFDDSAADVQALFGTTTFTVTR
jgi:hypothetical protein